VKNVRRTAVTRGPVHVTLGAARELTLPKVSSTAVGLKSDGFSGINGDRTKYQQQTSMTWGYNPASHLEDEDTFMENLPTLVDQARMVRAIAPNAATLRVAPIDFDAPYPRPAYDPRNRGLFAAAWSAAAVAYLAQAKVDEALFTIAPGAAAVLGQFTPLAGQPVLSTTLAGPAPLPISVLAVQHGGERLLWLINKTDQPQPVSVDKLGKTAVTLCRLNAQTFSSPTLPEEPAATAHGALALTLEPYEVCRVTLP
jgi:hypothetical protein